MIRFHSFRELADDTLVKIISFGTTSTTVIDYYNFCTKKLEVIMRNHKITFDRDLALDWLYQFEVNDRSAENSKRVKCGSYRRTIFLLDDNFNGRLDEWKIYTSVHQKYPNTQLFLAILDNYHDYLVDYDYAQTTIDFKMRCAKNILLYLESINVFDIKQCTHQILSHYFASTRFENRKPAGVVAEITRTKHFIIYLEENKYVDYVNLHHAAPTLSVKEEHIINVLSSEVESAILSDFPEFPTNLRNRAAYLLALRCGLRTSDIINLRFSNIDWDKKILHIVQKKTKVSLSMPIDNDTINALIDYILKERRECNLKYIFITAVGPKKRLKYASFDMYTRIKSSQIDEKPAHNGLHIMRKTFASKLLREGVALSIISGALGHEDKKRVNKYISTDEKNMKLCSLDITDFPYKGGRF